MTTQLIGARIRALREERKLSQDDLAYEAEVSRTTLSLESTGERGDVNLKIIGKLAKVLEVEPAELLRLPARKRGRSG